MEVLGFIVQFLLTLLWTGISVFFLLHGGEEFSKPTKKELVPISIICLIALVMWAITISAGASL